MQGVMGFLITTLQRNLPVKKCENQLRFDRSMTMSLWSHFFYPPCMSTVTYEYECTYAAYMCTRIYPTYQWCNCTLANIWGIFLIKVIKYLMLPDCRIVRYDSYPNVSVGCTVDGCCPCFFASCWTLSFLSVIDIIHLYCPGLVFSSGFRHFSFSDIPLRIFFPIMCPKHGNFNLLTV